MNPSIKSLPILQINSSGHSQLTDNITVEEPLEIKLSYVHNSKRVVKNLSVTMRTPGHDAELSAGFLFTEAIIGSNKEINNISVQDNTVTVVLNETAKVDLEKLNRNFYTTSSCGVCGKESINAIRTVCNLPEQKNILKIKKEILQSLPQKLQQQQNDFSSTGGIHASALFNTYGELIILREDVGRHNALDKLIGKMLMDEKLPIKNHLLLLSGRASFELIQKAAMAGIEMVAAIGAPSSLAIELATEFNITLIGFLRENRMNVYTNFGNVE